MPKRLLGVVLVTAMLETGFSSPCQSEPAKSGPETIRVMTFNIWVGGEAGKQSLSQTVRVIREAKADIVGLQETLGEEVNKVRPDNGKKIAEILGWNYLDQGDGTAVTSRFPITGATPKKWGVSLKLPSGRAVHMFNAHYSASPYQPYQFLGIPYGDAPFLKTEAELIQAAKQARGGEVTRMLEELQPVLQSSQPVFLTGDFNEPSFQDWTSAAVTARKCPLKVEYPATKLISEAGMKDAFRTVHPDEVAFRGLTWTPTTSETDPKDYHDRIDYVWFAGKGVKAIQCEVVGERKERADIVINPYPSDHRGVVATIEIESSSK